MALFLLLGHCYFSWDRSPILFLGCSRGRVGHHAPLQNDPLLPPPVHATIQSQQHVLGRQFPYLTLIQPPRGWLWSTPLPRPPSPSKGPGSQRGINNKSPGAKEKYKGICSVLLGCCSYPWGNSIEIKHGAPGIGLAFFQNKRKRNRRMKRDSVKSFPVHLPNPIALFPHSLFFPLPCINHVRKSHMDGIVVWLVFWDQEVSLVQISFESFLP